MENFRIDFTLSNPFPDGCRLGEGGEKNAAQLVITPPDNLASRDEIRSYVVAFSTENGPVRIGPFPKTETITVPVGNALTVGTALSVQLEGFDADGEFIIKSKVLSGIKIASSIRDCSCSDGSNDKNLILGHYHDNFEVLKNLADDDGILTYKGGSISGSGTVKTAVLLASESSFTEMIDVPQAGSFILVTYYDSEGNPYIPEGSEIISIEFNSQSEDNPEWVDLRSISETDEFMPSIINYHKSFYSSDYSGNVIAGVYFPFGTNSYYDEFSNYNINSLRIKYICGSGEAE